jgi:chaperonin GroES
MEFRPIQDYVVVRMLKRPEMAGSLYLPEARADEHLGTLEATVVSVGRGCHNKRGVFIPTELRPGQRVVLPTYHGKQMKRLGDDMAVIAESEILACYDEDEVAG